MCAWLVRADARPGLDARMKVLISAIACSPYGGSELYVGWSALKCLAQDHELWVLTSGRHRAEIEDAVARGLLPGQVHFVYAGQFKEYHPNRLLARMQSWKEYLNFSRSILAVARALHEKEKFDLVHHVTYATWRIATPLWRLGVPFVFGPIGGNTNVPLRFLPILSPVAAGFELLRTASNQVSRVSPAVRASLQHAAHVFTPDAETAALVARIRGASDGVSALCHAFFSPATIQMFARHGTARPASAPLRIFAGGNLIGTKGVALALPALARAKTQGVRFHYQLGGGGPELARLKKLVRQLGLSEDVTFVSLSGEAYRQALGASHLYLLPSLRESAGLTMMEAMLSGCVPIVADCGGPARIVTGECGYKIAVTSRQQMIADLTETLVTLDRRRELIAEKSVLAAARIATGFSEENYRQAVNAIYAAVAARKRVST